KLPGDTKWRPLTKGLKLPYGTRIETQLGAKAYIKWVENGKRVHAAVMQPLTQMTTGKHVKDEETVVRIAGLLKIGTVRVRVDKTALKCDLSVSTPNCVAGVTGTAFESSYDEATGTSAYVVFEGTVVVTNDRTGETVTIVGAGDGTGQRATIIGDTIVVDTVTDLDASPGGDWDFDAMFEEEGEQGSEP
ncbi:FecR family protein, partial [Candidatus Bipolaricaulota bacterium]|nr:FecR family protein [Candidatus Bipolaricaulota bacterium]